MSLCVVTADVSTPVVFVISRNLLVFVRVVTCKFCPFSVYCLLLFSNFFCQITI